MWLVADTQDLRGPIDGVNRRFIPRMKLRDDAVLYLNGSARIPGPTTSNGYRYDGKVVTMGEAPVPGDVVAIWQQDTETTFVGGPSPSAGIVSTLSPSIGAETMNPQASGWPPPTGSVSST